MKILVLPGLDGTGQLLDQFAQIMGRSHEVEVVAYPSSLASYHDIEAWLVQCLPEENFAIIAESFSGPLAISIASKAPRNLCCLILVATFARAPIQLPEALLRALKRLPYSRDILAKLSIPFVLGKWRPKDFMPSYMAALKSLPHATLFGRLEEVLHVDVRAQLAEIRAPIGFFRAQNDRLIRKSLAADFLPFCARVSVVPGPHFILQAKAEEMASQIGNFIQGN